MDVLLRQFKKYLTIGVLNTAIHWICFGLLVFIFEAAQAPSNVIAFSISVIFSFFANAKYTFDEKATKTRFILYTFFMGSLSYIVGMIADTFALIPFATLIIFSSMSLIIGFLYSRYIVFNKGY